MANRIYICGPMTPTRFDQPDDSAHEYTIAYREVMERDIRWLLECDGMALLSGWRRSQGAMFEHSIAAFLHKRITNVAEYCDDPVTIESAVRPRMSVAGNRPVPADIEEVLPEEGEVVFSEDALLVEGAIGPRHYDGDAGLDLWVAEEFVHLAKGEFKDVNCALRVELPKDTWALIQGRSSTFRKRGIHVVQGVIDNGYRGPIAVGCWNTTDKDVYIVKGESLAQLIVLPLIRPPVVHCNVSTESADGRSGRGFGSTGGINTAKAAEVRARG